MRSTAHWYDRSHTWACIRTHLRLFERRDPFQTHTISTNAIERTNVRSIALVLSQHVTFFLGQLLPFSPHFCTAPYTIFSFSPYHPALQPPPHRPSTSAPPPSTSALTYHSDFTPIFFIFFPIFSKPNFSQTPSFCSIFIIHGHKSSHGLCPFDFCAIIVVFAGG